jgi:secreted Zn-dependent insulinase-like peptidase
MNFKYLPPYILVKKYKNKLINKNYFIEEDILSVLDDIVFDDVQYILNNITHGLLKCFVYGNIAQKKSQILVDIATKILGNADIYKYKKIDMFPITTKKKQVTKISKNINDNNSALLLTYRIGYVIDNKTNDWAEKLCYINILDLIIAKEYFNQLRTIEQLGYIAKAYDSITGDSMIPVYGYSFLIQSSFKDSDYLLKRTLNFIQKFGKNIENMIDEFNNCKDTLLITYSKDFQNIYEEFNYNADIILHGSELFNKKQILLKTIQNISFANFVEFFNTYFINKSKQIYWIINYNSHKN